MSEDFAAVLENFEAEQSAEAAAQPAEDHNVIKGTVINVTPTHVVVDIGNKTDGMVPIAQATDREGKVKFQPGDSIDVMIDRQGIQPEGYILLSHEKASRLRNWDNLERAYREGLVVSGRVVGRIKGGLSVDVGVVLAPTRDSANSPGLSPYGAAPVQTDSVAAGVLVV